VDLQRRKTVVDLNEDYKNDRSNSKPDNKKIIEPSLENLQDAESVNDSQSENSNAPEVAKNIHKTKTKSIIDSKEESVEKSNAEDHENDKSMDKAPNDDQSPAV